MSRKKQKSLQSEAVAVIFFCISLGLSIGTGYFGCELAYCYVFTGPLLILSTLILGTITAIELSLAKKIKPLGIILFIPLYVGFMLFIAYISMILFLHLHLIGG